MSSKEERKRIPFRPSPEAYKLLQDHKILGHPSMNDMIDKRVVNFGKMGKIANPTKKIEKNKRTIREQNRIEADQTEPEICDNTCIFLVPWINESDQIICMKAFNKKDKVIKLPREACNDCYRKGFVIPSAPSIQKQEEERQSYNLIPKPKKQEPSKIPVFSTIIPLVYCPEKDEEVKATDCEFHKQRDYKAWMACEEWKQENPDPEEQKKAVGLGRPIDT